MCCHWIQLKVETGSNLQQKNEWLQPTELRITWQNRIHAADDPCTACMCETSWKSKSSFLFTNTISAPCHHLTLIWQICCTMCIFRKRIVHIHICIRIRTILYLNMEISASVETNSNALQILNFLPKVQQRDEWFRSWVFTEVQMRSRRSKSSWSSIMPWFIDPVE